MEKDPLIGTQLGAYFIQAKLGEGGMAEVYKAYHARLRREVAIKVILPQIADQSGFRERFEREAQLVASLEHHNIVAVYDFGEFGNLTYLVMQYVGGGTLRDLLRRDGRIEIHKSVQYAIQMARALHHAHQRGIVHRDVKPQNMLISTSEPDQLLLSDFGIAKLFNSNSQETMLTPAAGGISNDPSLTNADQMVGTAEYMSPEQINRQAVDARSDVYALGIVLFQMLTGQVPFSSTTIQGLLFQHVYTPPKSVREVNPSVPVALEQIIARALAKAPEHRYQSAEAMALALEAIHTPSTHQLPADNYTTFGRSSAEPTTYPTPYHPAPLYYGQHSASGALSTGQSITPTTSASMGGVIVPAPPRAKRFRLSYILYILATVIIVVFLFSRTTLPALCGIGLFCSTSQQTPTPSSGQATSFNEDFHNDDRSWTTGSQDKGNLTADLSNNQYTLTIGKALNTYFPNPSAVGTLPINFSLTAQIKHNKGGSNVFYGLAFRLRQDGSNVYCYAFVITDTGAYQVLKYNANILPKFSSLWSASSFPAIHDGQSNTLQATVHGGVFSFEVNGTPVPVGSNQATTISDTAYSGGNLALFVAGSNTSFVVTSVALTTQ